MPSLKTIKKETSMGSLGMKSKMEKKNEQNKVSKWSKVISFIVSLLFYNYGLK